MNLEMQPFSGVNLTFDFLCILFTPTPAHARPSAWPPIDTSGNFSAHVSAESLFEISPFSGQNRVILGGRGGPRIIFFIGILLFLLLRSPCKVSNSYDMSLLDFPHFPVKIGLFWGVGGVPEFFFLLESSYFCYQLACLHCT